MSLRKLPKIRDSLSFVYIEHARIDRSDHAVSVHDITGSVQVPCAALATVLLGPGTSITHAAVKTLADAGCSIVWVGEGSTRVYAQGMGETRSSRRLLLQAACHADREQRAAVVMRMYKFRFDEPVEPGCTIEQIRGKEGVRVRTAYARLSAHFQVPWQGRQYKRGEWGSGDAVNQALSTAATCLYGVCHAAIISAGYSAALGFIHTGKLLSFVYDIADLYRMDVVAPVAFEIASQYQGKSNLSGMGSAVRRACRQAFKDHDLMARVVADIDRVLELDEDSIEEASRLIDASVEAVGGIWDMATGEVIEGGINYGDTDPGEGSSDAEG